MLFATQNPPGSYGGRKVLSRAFRNRFLEMQMDEIPEDDQGRFQGAIYGILVVGALLGYYVFLELYESTYEAEWILVSTLAEECSPRSLLLSTLVEQRSPRSQSCEYLEGSLRNLRQVRGLVPGRRLPDGGRVRGRRDGALLQSG